MSFRFLDLPKELGLMVYERLPIRTRSYVLEDPIHVRDHPDAESHPSVAHVTKTLPVALLRTCRLIHEEAKPFLLRRLQDEPARYLFDVAAMTSLVAQEPRFHLYRAILEEQQAFQDEPHVPALQDVLCPAGRVRRNSTAYTFRSPHTSTFKLAVGSPEHASVEEFVLRCATLDALAERASCDVKRHANIRIGVRFPEDTNADISIYLGGCFHVCIDLGKYLAEVSTHMCMAVQPGTGTNEQRNAEYHDAIQRAVYLLDGTSYANLMYHVKQPSVEEWKQEWEDGYAF